MPSCATMPKREQLPPRSRNFPQVDFGSFGARNEGYVKVKSS